MPILTPEQCKMARAGTGMGIKELAEAAEVSPNTVVRLERGENIRPRTLRRNSRRSRGCGRRVH